MNSTDRDIVDDRERTLSREGCDALARRVMGFAAGGGRTRVRIHSAWVGELRWARNLASASGDRRLLALDIRRLIHGMPGDVTTNQTDDASLKSAIGFAEWLTRKGAPRQTGTVDPVAEHQYSAPVIWSKVNVDQTVAMRAEILRAVTAPVRAAGMLTAGYLSVTTGAKGLYDSATNSSRAGLYAGYTQAQCSLTVRHPEGTSSGWAGASSYDWARIDPARLVQVALDKCVQSQNAVRLEPGRYQVILEPQATYDLLRLLISPRILNRYSEEVSPSLPLHESPGFAKLGRQILDERITLSHDPIDPQLGVVPFSDEWYLDDVQPYRAVTWVDRGVLMKLPYDRRYALQQMNDNEGYPNSTAIRMSGGTATIDEMIASMKRGLLVTRFSNIKVIDQRSLLASGYTRDGLWLIIDGKISHAVKNFRMTESPLFAFNNVESLGVPVPVFSPDAPAVVPAVQVRDFNFSSVADAV